jgi:pimeloyl-ACP methyl ester carboxylesterase
MKSNETMMETVVQIGEDKLFLRHNRIKPHCKTLLFVHGLGESGMCFRDVFQYRQLDAFNLLVPDLVGNGRSSVSRCGDYRFDSHVERLWKLVEQNKIDDLAVIGHSMGGDITTLMCESDSQGIIKKYVNIEGDVTRFDLFISGEALKAHEKGDFHTWFNQDFMITMVRDGLGKLYDSCRRYYESLKLCSPDAFLANSRELVERNNNSALPGDYKSEIGKIYAGLTIPRVYCYGTKSIPGGTLRFLKENHLETMACEGAGHWVMIDKADEFYSFLYEFITGC